MPIYELSPAARSRTDDALFAAIADALRSDGVAVFKQALPAVLQALLCEQFQAMRDARFHPAGIGRQRNHTRAVAVRSDSIAWIDGESVAGRAWLEWCAALQSYLNRSLLLGLFSFESHFAHYAPGDFYRRHVDAFNGEANRVVSLVAYFNPQWEPADGGELVLYGEGVEEGGRRVLPELGTLVVFLSEEFPHEVLPARRDRLSVAGWFRVNGSAAGRVDPPD